MSDQKYRAIGDQFNRQNAENLHTIQQIKESGHIILSKSGAEILRTQRGKTITKWAEKEPQLWYPFDANTIY